MHDKEYVKSNRNFVLLISLFYHMICTVYQSTKTLDYIKVSIENMDHGRNMEISVDKWDDRGGKSVPVDT